MEYHPEWDMPDPSVVIANHKDAMIRLLTGADFAAICLEREVQSYMNANALIWGWKQPTTDRDRIDLYEAVLERYDNFRFEVNHDLNHILEVLRADPGKVQLIRPETMEDHYQPRHYDKQTKKRDRKVDTENDWTNGIGTQDVSVPVHNHYHSHFHDCGTSDSGSGGCD